MSTLLRGDHDIAIDQVLDAVGKYGERHPNARIDAYRQNSVSIRVRIVDADFAEIDRAERHEIVWRLLEKLPEDVQSQMSLLLLLTPDEMKMSLANFDFDNPIPSDL